MKTHKPSQTQLYGVVLTDQDQYLRDLRSIPKLSKAEEKTLTQRAQEGDQWAREEIIIACYPYCQALGWKYARAYSWASARIDALDLMQIGIVRAVECLDRALECDNTFCYLYKAIAGTIVTYCHKWGSLVVCGQNHDGQYLPPVKVESLDAPLNKESDDTLSDLIADESQIVTAQRDYTPLYESLETLVERQKDAVRRYYGIECANESYEEIGSSWGIDKRPASYASTYEQRGVAALRKKLVAVYG